MKRVLDIAVSSTAILFFLPFGLIIASILKLTGEGEVLYVQQRTGKNGRLFGLFKFVINAFLLWVTDKLMDDFEIEGFGTTLIAAFLISIIDSMLRWVF